MKVTIKQWNAVAQWRWDVRGTNRDKSPDRQGPKESISPSNNNNRSTEADNAEDELCGICRVAFEACCPSCKTPGDDCPLIWGKCSHVFHMHCLLKWIGTAASKGQCPMDRREWENAER